MILLVTQHRAFSRLHMEREHVLSVLKLHELWRAILDVFPSLVPRKQWQVERRNLLVRGGPFDF